MKLTSNELFKAVRYALYTGAAATVGFSAVPAFAQDSNSADSGQKLETITVTGSNIRRVDIETSNPVVTVDRAAIAQSGKLTVGDLLQQLPVSTGSPISPTTNNSGGTGGSFISLRGLGSQRTLILVDGHRIINPDVNSIPTVAIERIEVLTDGASAVYGSDAVGGVVNFILRKDYQGAEFRADYGTSDHDDGVRKGYHFTFGQTSDKGSILVGIDYNKQDAILGGQRDFAKTALALSSSNGVQSRPFLGSGSPEHGRIQLPSSAEGLFNCGKPAGQNFVAINPGANGQTVDTANYHCYTSADSYNYAPVNYVLTPQERSSLFVNGEYHLTDNVDAYLSAYHNKTTATSQLAPGIIGTNPPGGLVISSQSYYNPFGQDFSSSAATFQLRNVAGGPRITKFSGTTDQLNTGLKGHFDIGEQNWTWDAGFGYGHLSGTFIKYGLPNVGILNADLGPSFLDPTTGIVTCGTAAQPITTGCTPFNIFDVNNGNDPAAIDAIRKAATPATNTTFTTEKYEHLDISGGLFDLPAGTIQLAGGVSHRTEYTSSTVDSLLQNNPDAGYSCTLGSQCSGSLQGGYSVKEAYAELFVPILKDIPFIHSLNLTVGDRYSKYSNFGSTSNWKVALEYRPIEDVLLRGTVSKVFRAPAVLDIFGAPSSSSQGLVRDPCDYAGTGANPNAGSPACVGVPATGPFLNNLVATGNQANAIASGSAFANYPLKPELGKSFDFGVVYDPHWLEGLSVSADLWRVYLTDTISGPTGQTLLDLCFNGATQYCSYIQRQIGGVNAGQPTSFIVPTINLGRTDVAGVDFAGSYRLPEFAFGRFALGLQATYIKKSDTDPAPGLAGDVTLHGAGHFAQYAQSLSSVCNGATGGVCTIPRWKAVGLLSWNFGSFDASLRTRYIGRVNDGNADLSQGSQAYLGRAGSVVKIGAFTYNDLTFGYNIEPINTRLDFGVDNIDNKQPPFFGFAVGQTLNLGTDPSTYDVIGRYYHGSITVKF